MYTVWVLKQGIADPKEIDPDPNVEVTNQDVRNWRLRVSRRGWTGYYKDWPEKRGLWSLPYEKIINFLLERRNEATDPSEYYITLPYLSNDIAEDLLDVTFENWRSNHTRSGAIACLEPVKGSLMALEPIKNELNVEI
jgi:hypothetical protein